MARRPTRRGRGVGVNTGRLDAVPLQERYWVLVLAGVLSLAFAGRKRGV